MTIAIKTEGLGKCYTISHHRTPGYRTLRDALTEGLFSLSQRGARKANEEFWALRKLDLDIRQGERLGIVGRNGAGKSTLLKLLSRITQPTEGRMSLRGRVASLLEVGTGFHSELTGRENIFLNGAVMNMRARDIQSRFDEIVEFAEIGEFLDTPVKRYSSGMFMRLAFSVAAHLEPEILLVDEVLAVGDAEFRRKCLGKMGDIAAQERTILFVSHNMGAVRQLCDRAIWLDGGCLVADGNVNQVIDQYQSATFHSMACREYPQRNGKVAQVRKVRMLNTLDQESADFVIGENPVVEIGFDLNRDVSGIHVAVIIHSADGTHLFSTADSDLEPGQLGRRKAGRYVARVEIPFQHFNAGIYLVTVGMGPPGGEPFDRQETVSFSVHDGGSFGTLKESGGRSGLLLVEAPWHYLERAK
jgi:lipopolysaccharide transport system ATP-binding protein